MTSTTFTMTAAGVLALAVASATLSAQGPAGAAPSAEMRLIGNYEALWAKADAQQLAALYADDAVMVAGDGLTVGRTAIEQRFARSFAGPWKGGTFKARPGRTQVLSSDVRVIEGTFTVSGLTDASGKTRTAYGRYVNTLVNKGGTWLVAAAASFETPGPR